MTQTAVRLGVSLKAVPLPAEHGGWAFLVEPMLLGMLLALRAVSSIVYVRARLRKIHGQDDQPGVVIAVHLTSVAVSGLLWASQLTNLFALLGTSLLLARAVYGLTMCRETRAKRIGMQEVLVGVGYVVVCVMSTNPL